MSLPFEKYPSLENHYRTKSIGYFHNLYPALHDEDYILQEKIDGANFSIYISQDSYSCGKRTSALAPEDRFYNYQSTIVKYEPFIKQVQEWMKDNDSESIILYAEIYGANIQKRISYTEERSISIYDMKRGSVWLSQDEFEDFCNEVRITPWMVPTLTRVSSLQEALDFTIEGVKTQCGDTEWDPYNNKNIEGVVIKPYFDVYLDRNGSRFSLKMKCESFNDKTQVKSNHVVIESSDECKAMITEYSCYLNENRVLDYFSKEGEIDDPKQIGKYLGGIMADAKEDFFKDHIEAFKMLDDKEKRRVFSVSGSLIVPLLNKYL